MKTNKNLLAALVIIAAVIFAAWTTRGSAAGGQSRAVFYRVVHKDSINRASADLYMKSLTPHGGAGWELALIDGDFYVFKQVR